MPSPAGDETGRTRTPRSPFSPAGVFWIQTHNLTAATQTTTALLHTFKEKTENEDKIPNVKD